NKMLNRILLVCLLFAGSSLTCKWMDTNFKRYTEGALALLKTMKMNSTNSTDDVELPDAAAFPNELYRHASKAPVSENVPSICFAAHVLDEIVVLFGEDQTHASWSARTGEDFLNVITQQADGVASCVSITSHKKSHRKMSMYFKRLALHVLEEMEHSADAWELIREQVRLHIYRAQRLAEA
uniref:Type I interferon n=1 Tax=Neogobius melanostomus TaxID=47308 RepID=A0A8C6SPF9_9GOBI